MTPKEAAVEIAARTGRTCSRQRVMQYVKTGRLAAVMVDGRWDISEESIREFEVKPWGRPNLTSRYIVFDETTNEPLAVFDNVRKAEEQAEIVHDYMDDFHQDFAEEPHVYSVVPVVRMEDAAVKPVRVWRAAPGQWTRLEFWWPWNMVWPYQDAVLDGAVVAWLDGSFIGLDKAAVEDAAKAGEVDAD